jgi:hypothetical protein
MIEKHVAVRRSDLEPTLYWWNLPLALPRLVAFGAEALTAGHLVVHPGSALGAHAAALGARVTPGDTATVRDVQRLLVLRTEGEIGPLTGAFFPASAGEAELAPRWGRFLAELERLPFTIAFAPVGDGRARHEFCFRVPGHAVVALEELALGRRFGSAPGQLEMELLVGLALPPGRRTPLRLVLQDGGARLVRDEAGGRRQRTLLHSGQGYTGVREETTLAAALRARCRESWRRFPVGVVMFAGLPFFIAAFWVASLLRRRK